LNVDGVGRAVKSIVFPLVFQVEDVLGRVQESLATENSETKIGDTKQLQAVCAALDEVTKPLADVLMDKAMEAMLRKRGVIT